ncbi:MAG: hypothetical protein WAO12_08190 [Venatoribacter sp.]
MLVFLAMERLLYQILVYYAKTPITRKGRPTPKSGAAACGIISPITISSGACGWFGLGPISVLPAYQQPGVGAQLMKNALAALAASDASGCVVLGEFPQGEVSYHKAFYLAHTAQRPTANHS